jgi:hypothetical protein
VFVSYVGGSEEDDEWIAVSKVCESMSVAVAVAVAVSVSVSVPLPLCRSVYVYVCLWFVTFFYVQCNFTIQAHTRICTYMWRPTSCLPCSSELTPTTVTEFARPPARSPARQPLHPCILLPPQRILSRTPPRTPTRAHPRNRFERQEKMSSRS